MKINMKTILAPVVLGTALLQLVSCGSDSGSGTRSIGRTSSEPEPRLLEEDAEGMYVAQMHALNNGVGGAISAALSINKEGSRLIAYMRLNGGHPKVAHQQRVHVGTSCPTAANDTNGDGYIDINEAFEHVGKILFPLDADISAQERGSSIWPAGDIYGYYHWERATSYERFISDLREPDLNPENDYAKLGPDGPLNLDGRVVLIHGANELSNLPDTVGSRGRLANHQTIPIACGVIKKVTKVPGRYEEDPSHGPAEDGETVGGSSGADDGAIVPVDGVHRPGESDGETTGPTNDADEDPRFSGGSAGGSRSGGSTSGGGTTGGSTSGGSTSGGGTSAGTSGGTTNDSGSTTTESGSSGTNYGDDDGE